MEKTTANKTSVPGGIKIVAFLMILFGLTEMVTGFTHRFLVLETSSSRLATYAGSTLGFFYLTSGSLLLSGRRWAAVLAITLLVADVIGRVGMVGMGLYPVHSTIQIVGMAIGTLIVVIFAVYVGIKMKRAP